MADLMSRMNYKARRSEAPQIDGRVSKHEIQAGTIRTQCCMIAKVYHDSGLDGRNSVSFEYSDRSGSLE